MDVKNAIKIAKAYVNEVLGDEGISNLGLEEFEHDAASDAWNITLAFSRPWNTPRTRAQEVLESMGAVTSLRRSYKVITVTADGDVLAMKNKQTLASAE